MNNIQIFQNNQFGQIRVATTENGEPLFCLADLCKALDLDASQVVKRLDDGVVSIHPTQDSLGRIQNANFVNEDGMYDTILDSRKAEAKQFRKWTTSEILPSIRKSGGYIISRTDDNPETIMARALIVARETLERKDKELKELKPKALFADAVATSNRSCLVAELAKILQQNNVEIGQNRLFEWLRVKGYLCSKGEYYNQPTQKGMDLGLFELKKSAITKPDGTVLTTTTTKVTGKGQIYFVNKFLNEKLKEDS